MKIFIMQTTFSSKKEAKKMSKILLKKRLTPCVQMVKCNSSYRWEDKICKDKEWQLNIKTKKANLEKIKRIIKELHSYDLPEILVIKVAACTKEYKEFVEKNC